MEGQSHSPLQEAPVSSQSTYSPLEALAPSSWASNAEIAEAFSYGYSDWSDSPSARTKATHAKLLARRYPPDLIEATGSMSGLLDKLIVRRDRIDHAAFVAILAWVRKLAAEAPVDQILHLIDDPQEKDPKSRIVAILSGVLSQYPDLDREVTAIVADAHANASAEGTVSAGSVINHHHGFRVPNLNDTFDSELSKNKKSDFYWVGAEKTVALILSGLAGDIVQAIKSLISKNAADETISKAVANTIAVGAGAVFYLGYAIHQFFATAQLDHINNAGEKIDFLTMGDGRVCAQCADAEDGNPYSIDNAPPIPNHGGCRCWYSVAGAIT